MHLTFPPIYPPPIHPFALPQVDAATWYTVSTRDFRGLTMQGMLGGAALGDSQTTVARHQHDKPRVSCTRIYVYAYVRTYVRMYVHASTYLRMHVRM